MSADELGVTYMHEHLIIDSPLVEETMPHIHLPDTEDAVNEMALCRHVGVGTVVDAMPAGSGRVVERLAEVSRRSGVHVIASTGLHTARYYETVGWARTEDVDDLAERFVADVIDGVDHHDYLGATVERTRHRAGIIKVATAINADRGWDRRLFEAGAIASQRTGAPILTHCEEGRRGLDQVDLLAEFDVHPRPRRRIAHRQGRRPRIPP